jgi:hypothetical protein
LEAHTLVNYLRMQFGMMQEPCTYTVTTYSILESFEECNQICGKYAD